ncbi:hypothetical protein [Haliangium sp.]|uniref:hypothetical protein n=1 Tax=Haliangium sp. TaxID=2663208 RepID=UPI003D112061
MVSVHSSIVKWCLPLLLGSVVGCGQLLGIEELSLGGPDAANPDANVGTPADARSEDAAPPDAAPPAAPPDATPFDAPPSLAYEIAYVNDMTFDPSAGQLDIIGFLVVINTGEISLDLSATRVQSFYDDSAQVGYTLSLEGDTTTALQPGEAAGGLSPLATQSIIGSGLVSEPLVDTTYTFRMALNNLPSDALDVNAQAVLNIDGQNIALSFTIHFVPEATTEFRAARVALAN